jgi:Icc-related predicted phosphoesterase
MARFQIFSDIHNDAKTLGKLMNQEADAYFCAGDLVSWAKGLDKMGEAIRSACPKGPESIYVMPGNHESARDIERFCTHFGFQNFHGKTAEIGGVRIAGLGYSTITPFDTPGEFTEEQMADQLAGFETIPPDDMRKLVLICHAPPLNTALDQIRPGLHGGSQSVREFIEKHQPAHFFCGHIHEAEGLVIQMGATRAMNVGKKGYLLEL